MSQKHTRKYCEFCGSSQERLYSIESASKLCDCSQQFFRNLVRDRRIGFVKVERMVRIPESELTKIIHFFPSIKDNVRELLMR